MARRRRVKGEAVVFQRSSDGLWIARVTVTDPFTGKPVRHFASSASETEIQLKAKALEALNPSHVRSTDMTVAEYLGSWIERNLPHAGVSPRTVDMYEGCLRRYAMPSAQGLRLDTLTPTLCEEWFARISRIKKVGRLDASGQRSREGAPISPSTVRNTYTAAVRALDTAVRDGLLDENPLRKVKRPKVPRTEVPVTKPDEVDRLLAACQGRRIEGLVWFVSYTGVRIGEALALRWSDVDLDQGFATIRRGSQGSDVTKNGRVRMVTLLPEVTRQLRRVQKQQRVDAFAMGASWGAGASGDWVFTSATGRLLDRQNVTHELQRALRAAGVTTRRPWHSLRHGLAHRLLAKGMPLHLVSAMLGHSGIGITNDLYGHVDSRIPLDTLQAALK